MTDQEILEKLKDPRYFIERFFHIVDKTRARVPFKLNLPQTKYFDNRTSFDLILKARKEGFSSLIEALWLHACLFGKYVRAVTMSHEMESTKRHFDRVRYFLENMGVKEWKFEVELDEESQKQITFAGNESSYWIGTAGAKAFGRGDDITHLHLSEVAHYDNQDVLTGALEACVPKALRVMETTANGVGERFHKLWRESKSSQFDTKWKPHFFSWFEDPTNRLPLPTHINFRLTATEQIMQRQYKLDLEQVNWYRNKRAEMPDKEKMPQEYPSNDQEAFLSSGRHAFNLQKITEKKARIKPALYTGDLVNNGAKVEFVDNDEGKLRIWKMPRMGAAYLVVGDVSQGVPDGDYSVAPILDRSSWEQVGIWRGRVDPGTFGETMVHLGLFFNNAVLVPELNNHGWATVERIRSLNYPHLLNTKEIWKEGVTPVDGFPTNERTRPLVITALRNANDNDTIYFNDLITLEEMETFVQNEDTGKFEAQEGCHDDCVMAMAIGTYCLNFLTVDETYAEFANQRRGSPLLTQTIAGTSGRERKSATGYR